VKRIGTGLLALIAAASLAGSPALAAKRAARHTVTCKQIKDALDSGKSADDVAKDLKVSAARVKSCTTPPAKHGRKGTAKSG
jgi:hypothetical protein